MGVLQCNSWPENAIQNSITVMNFVCSSDGITGTSTCSLYGRRVQEMHFESIPGQILHFFQKRSQSLWGWILGFAPSRPRECFAV